MTESTPIPAGNRQNSQQRADTDQPSIDTILPPASTASTPTEVTQLPTDTLHPQTGAAQADQYGQRTPLAVPHPSASSTLPQSQPQPLPQAIVNVWITRSVIGCTVGVFIIVAVVIAGILAGLPAPAVWAIIIAALLLWTLLIVTCVIIAKYRYRFTSYRIDRTVFSVQTGFMFRTLTVVPYTRVQHVETKQGPILRHFGLVSVTVSTAVDSHVIAGLEPELARKTLDQLAELVRLAKEDL
ncbi:PH domain-containing protein [Bifidobacterium apri]|uniref:PH domain-containing protein n=1 Tax=Bifidobacterium apri TaxID=1769423 RepID=UPI003991257F